MLDVDIRCVKKRNHFIDLKIYDYITYIQDKTYINGTSFIYRHHLEKNNIQFSNLI